MPILRVDRASAQRSIEWFILEKAYLSLAKRAACPCAASNISQSVGLSNLVVLPIIW